MTSDRAPGWRSAAVWYAYLMTGLLTFFFNIQGNIVPFIKDELGLSYRLVSFHSSALALGVLLVGALGERALRAVGRRPSYWIGTAGMVAGALLICAAPSAWVSIPGFAVMGAFGAMLPIVGVSVVADVPLGWRAVSYAEANVMAYAFALSAPLLMGLSVSLGVGWRGPLFAGAAIAAVILWFYRATKLPGRLTSPSVQAAPLPAAFWAYWLLLTLGISIEFAVLLWIPEFLEQVVGLDRGTAATWAATFFAAMLIGRFTGSRLVRLFSPYSLYYVALSLTLLGFLVYWGLSGPVAAVAGLFLLGLGIAQYYPLTATLAVATVGPDADKASARLVSATGVSLLVIPAVMGVLADAVGLRLAHLVVPLLLAGALGTFTLARRLERRVTVPTPV